MYTLNPTHTHTHRCTYTHGNKPAAVTQTYARTFSFGKTVISLCPLLEDILKREGKAAGRKRRGARGRVIGKGNDK